MSDTRPGAHSLLRMRLLGEFLVIVLGVLVALAVDAAWGVRLERHREQAYYGSLARDLVQDTAEYAMAIRMTARSIEAGRQVRSVILGDPASSDRPLSQSLTYASWVNYPDWSSGTLDELFSSGTIRLIRDPQIKDAIHAYRSRVDEWRPRMQGPEYGAFLTYRRAIAGLIPLEARIAYETKDDVGDLRIDEASIARRLGGDEALLRETETMMIQWASLKGLYEGQRQLALSLLHLLSERAEIAYP